MSKNKNTIRSDAEDYLAQADWQSQQSQRRSPLPWYMEPKWSYKRVASSQATTGNKISVPAKIFLVILFFGLGYFLYMINVSALIAYLFIGVFLFLMIRDASKKSKDDN